MNSMIHHIIISLTLCIFLGSCSKKQSEPIATTQKEEIKDWVIKLEDETLIENDLPAEHKASFIRGLIIGFLHQKVILEASLSFSQEEIDIAVITIFNGDKASIEIAKKMILNWKVCQKIYQKHGGVVAFQQANPLEPIGAYRLAIIELELSGLLSFKNQNTRDEVMSYFDIGNHSVVDEVDYSKPWWLQKP